jgi:hypothetical protein
MQLAQAALQHTPFGLHHLSDNAGATAPQSLSEALQAHSPALLPVAPAMLTVPTSSQRPCQRTHRWPAAAAATLFKPRCASPGNGVPVLVVCHTYCGSPGLKVSGSLVTTSSLPYHLTQGHDDRHSGFAQCTPCHLLRPKQNRKIGTEWDRGAVTKSVCSTRLGLG